MTLKNRKYSVYNQKINKIDTLFISHLPNQTYLFNNDFYFGNGPEVLKNNGEKVCVLLHNQNNKILTNSNKDNNLAIKIVIPKVLNLKEELETIKKALNIFIETFKLYKKENKKEFIDFIRG
jgi:hypothetical protein